MKPSLRLIRYLKLTSKSYEIVQEYFHLQMVQAVTRKGRAEVTLNLSAPASHMHTAHRQTLQGSEGQENNPSPILGLLFFY